MPRKSPLRDQRRFGRRQLEWVQHNRRMPGRCQSLGSLATELEKFSWVNNRNGQVIYDAICSIADEAFCRHCRLGRVSGGEVVILVESSADVYHIRGLWQDKIRDELTLLPPRLRRGRVAFRPVGRDEWERGVAFHAS